MVSLVNDNLSESYRTTEELFNKKTFLEEDLYLDGSYAFIEDNDIKGFIICKLNNTNVKEYEDTAWINSIFIDKKYQGKGIGTLLLKECESSLREKNVKKIIVGCDFNNFYSGIPEPTEHKENFFSCNGYILNDQYHYDLINNISKMDFNKYKSHREEFKGELLKYYELPKLNSFLQSSFPERWAFEIEEYIRVTKDIDNIILLKKKEDIIGFCKVEIFKDNVSIGSLGPIGVSENCRGRGLGKKILVYALEILQHRKVENVLIDWTILKDFYGQFGFTPHRTYKGAYKITK